MMFSEKLSRKIYRIPFAWILTLLFFIFFIVFINSVFNGFVWDDEEQIVNNTVIQSLSNLGQIFSGATFGTGGAGLSGWFFRPLLTLSYMVSFSVFGQNAWGYHLLQIILHLINGILIFKILQSLINKDRKKEISLLNYLMSFLFLIHPVITEAVDYIAASSEVIYTLLDLLAFYMIINFGKTDGARKKFLISLLIFSSMLFKESAIIILPIIAIYILIFKTAEWRKWTITTTATFAAYFFVRLLLANTPIRQPEFSPISEASLPIRLLTIPKEFISYLHIIFYPDRLAISQHFLVKSVFTSDFYIPFLIDSIFVLIILFLSLRFKSKLILFGLLWFGLGFGLISNIFPLDMTIAERWIYFPFVGFIIMTSGILYEISKKIKFYFVFILILLFALIFPLGIRTIIRNSNWQNGLTLYSHDEKISINSFDLENNLGVELFRNGDYKNAKLHFEKSIILQPKWYFTYNNLGAVYQRSGDLQTARKLYQKTISLSDYYLAYENLATILLQTESSQNTLNFTLKALGKLPNNASLNKIAAIAYYQNGSTESAVIYAKRAFNLDSTQENYEVLQKILSQ